MASQNATSKPVAPVMLATATFMQSVVLEFPF